MSAELVDASDIAVVGPPPDRVTRVPVEGGRVVAYVYGDRHNETILCINGGPGVSSRYMRDGFRVLTEHGFRVVVHDQLGTGASDRPDDPSLWTLGRYVAEVEAVRQALGNGKVHLLGHSWGGWLGTEYAVTHPEKLKSCIFSNTSANMPVHLEELRRLLAAFGTETLAMIDRLEAAGNLASPFYRAICTLFYGRHSSRKTYLAGGGNESEAVNMQIQTALWGPAEFSATGELATWNRLPDLHRVTVPSLVLVGADDYLTPRSAGLIHAHLPDSRMVLFPESGHAPHTDEPEAYFGVVTAFLKRVIGG
jgi:proline iminopeptidase